MESLSCTDKFCLSNTEELHNRNKNLREVINNKTYDISYEDEIAKYVINESRYKNMLLIKFEYYLFKSRDFDKGGMVFYDNENDKLYAIELRSLKDKYSKIPDNSKIEKCINQSIRYSEYTKIWASKDSIPVSIIEMEDGSINITEKNIVAHNTVHNTAHGTIYNGFKEYIKDNQWHSNKGDHLTKYKINGDTLESERIVNFLPSSESRKLFKGRAKIVCKECTNCTIYSVTMKSPSGCIYMQEYYTLCDNDTEL